MTIELEKLIGGGNFKELCKFLFLNIKIIGLIKPIVGKGLVNQDVIVSLACDGAVPSLYKRYVDDTLATMPNTDAAADFLTTLNGLRPSLRFTMELPIDNIIPFIGMEIVKNGIELETHVYRKPTNTGLLLHFQSHVDKRYKTALMKTMLHRAYALSSTTEAFNGECAKLRSIFSRLDYPIGLINSTINMFI